MDAVDEIQQAAKKAKLVAGSEEWSKKIRKKAKVLSRTLDTGYMELAELLYTIYDTPVNGDPKNQAVWQSWGYTNFDDYVEQELGMHRRKAQRLRRIWYTFENELTDLDRSLKKRLISVGWTKVRELIRVLTAQNAEKWIEMAENTTYPDLLANIAKAIEIAEQKSATLGDTESKPEATPPEDKEKVKSLSFALVEAQYENVMLALKRAGEMTKSESRNHNLDMICTDFLGTNDFKLENDPEMLLRYLTKFEKLFNVRLMVVDPAKRKMLYGMEALELIATDEEVE